MQENDESASNGRPLLFYDDAGQPYQPVRNFNRTTGASAYRIKPRGADNRAENAIETEDIFNVARAMLVEGLASRVKALSGGPVNYLTYGGPKLIRYELDPALAAKLGVPPSGNMKNPLSFSKAPAAQARPTPKDTTTNMQPKNLILYGPPGTGKTYATAAEALRLCGEAVPEDRDALMSAYRRLCAEKRIDFVTFHQSMSYEDFVEGLRPQTGPWQDAEMAEGPGVGFSLVSRPGLFRRIAARAATSSGRPSPERAISVAGRKVFKMSLGATYDAGEAHLFEEAISEGHVVVGYADIDWTDEVYADRTEIMKRLKNEGIEEAKLTPYSGWFQTPVIFRNWMRPGDIVIVSKGNLLFRAIGEITGEYEFHPRDEGDYAHRRTVRWLWVDRAGVPVDEIYGKAFTMKTVYQLTESDLNVPALERYMNSQAEAEPGSPDPFVLIIDEINRANISKVFGELITLIEPDKRLGAKNEVKVRLPYSGDDFGVPANLHIIGTMNTADRSIALLDTALRRRFEFREMMPEPEALREAAERCGIDLPRLLATLNERIEYLYDREHRIGHAYFIDCSTPNDVDEVMRTKVIPLLSEYFFEDWGKVAAVLGDAGSGGGAQQGGFLTRTALEPPPGLDDDGNGMERARWTVRGRDQGFNYSRLVGG